MKKLPLNNKRYEPAWNNYSSYIKAGTFFVLTTGIYYAARTLGWTAPLFALFAEDLEQSELKDATTQSLSLKAASANKHISIQRHLLGVPSLLIPIDNHTINAGEHFSFTIPENTFEDPDSDPLSLLASFSNDTALPSWLLFNGDTQWNASTFSGTPPENYEATLSVKVTASDASNSVSDDFNLRVGVPNYNEFEIASPSVLWGNADDIEVLKKW